MLAAQAAVAVAAFGWRLHDTPDFSWFADPGIIRCHGFESAIGS
jgi:hypothetical protein